MVHDFDMFMLRTEKYHFRVIVCTNSVPRRPVEYITGLDDLFGIISKGHCKLSFKYMSPVWAVAEIAMQTFQQWSHVCPGTQREVLSADLSISGNISEIDLLSRLSTRYIDFDRNIVFIHSHLTPPAYLVTKYKG